MNVTSAGRGHGSTFFFELPVYGPDYSPPQPREESAQPQHQPKPARVGARSRLLSPSSVACEGPIAAFVAQEDTPEPLFLSQAVQGPAIGPDSAAVLPESKILLYAR